MRSCRGVRRLRLLSITVLLSSVFLLMPSSPALAAATGGAQVETELVALVNADRTSNGLRPLVLDLRLVGPSREWSRAQAAAGAIRHDPEIGQALPPGTKRWAENVGRTEATQDEAHALHAAFMASPGHRATLMSPGYQAIGVGVVRAGGTTWVTQRVTDGTPTSANPVDAYVADLARNTYGAGGAERAVIVRDDDFPDALAASALAGDSGPVLFTPRGPALLPHARRALDEILPPGRTVYVIGGAEAVDPAIDEELAAAGWEVVRVAGGDRYSTAAEVARVVTARDGTPRTVLLATGANWPDAAAGAAFASRGDAVVLLAELDEVPDVTWDALDEIDEERVIALGGTAALSEDVVDATGARRVAGNSREETAVAIAEELWEKDTAAEAREWTIVAANDPDGWAWAFGSAPWAARTDAPILLAADPVGERVVEYLDGLGYGDVTGHAVARGPIAETSLRTVEDLLR